MKKIIISIWFILLSVICFSQDFKVLGLDTLTGRPGYLFTLRPTYTISPLITINDSTIGMDTSRYYISSFSKNAGGDSAILLFTGGRRLAVKDSSGGGTSGWLLTGNSGTDSATKFIGTTDSKPFQIKTKNTTRMYFDTLENVGIGTTAPTNLLQIVKNTNGFSSMDIKNGTIGTAAAAGINAYGNAGSMSMQAYSSGFSTSGMQIANTGRIVTSSGFTGGMVINVFANAPLILGTNNQEIARFLGSAGQFGLGLTVPTSWLDIKAGTTSIAPLGLTSGTSLVTPVAGKFEYTTPQLFFTNGGLQRQEIPQIQQSRVSTQYDKTNSATLTDVTGLTATLVAGKTYRVEAILYTTSNIAAGVQFAIGGTATATNIIYEAIVDNGAVISAQTRATAMATQVGAVTAVTAAYAKITGLITVNAAGTLTVQFAQNVSNAVSSSVLVGSTFVVTQMN